METSKKSIGKILKIDYDLGYGEIITDDKKALNLASKAEIKVFSNGKFVTVKPPKRENPLTYFIRLYGEHIRDRKNITPFFVLYC